ncbi:hypothetical protein D3C77_685870 [compost metagenome]
MQLKGSLYIPKDQPNPLPVVIEGLLQERDDFPEKHAPQPLHVSNTRKKGMADGLIPMQQVRNAAIKRIQQCS